jgi:hypothetical protein
MQLRCLLQLLWTRGGIHLCEDCNAVARAVQVVGVMASLFCGQTSWAQTTAESSWENLRSLRAGQKIEVFLYDLRSQRGEFLEFSSDAVSLIVKNDTFRIPREQVLRVSTREKSKRLRNILIGAAIGTAAGFGAGAVVDSKATESGENLGRFIGFLAGVGGGAGIGAAIPGNQTIYRARAAVRSEARERSSEAAAMEQQGISREGAENSHHAPLAHCLLSASE